MIAQFQNIRIYRDGDDLNNAIDSLVVDIIALQEIENATKLNQLTNQLGSEWVNFRAFGSSDYGELAYLINTDEKDGTFLIAWAFNIYLNIREAW